MATGRHWRWRFAVCACAHGGVRGGVVHGASDKVGGFPREGRVNPEDLTALDWLEGYPDYYTRSQQRVATGSRIVLAYVYHMQPGNGYAPPSQHYWELVTVGYKPHSVPLDQLLNAAELATEVGTIG